MQKNFKLPAIVATGLMALPLLLAVGCNDSDFAGSDGADATSLAQENVRRGAPGDETDGETSPLEDCAKAGTTKVLVCHVPPGNPAALHTICVAAQGATNGHGLDLADPYAIGGHGGDRLGSCDAIPPEDGGGCPEEGC